MDFWLQLLFLEYRILCVQWSHNRKLNRISIHWRHFDWFLLHHCISETTSNFNRTTACIHSNPDFIFSLHFFRFLFTFSTGTTISDHFPFVCKTKERKKTKNEIFIVSLFEMECYVVGQPFMCVCIDRNLILKSINRTNPMPQISPINKVSQWMRFDAQLPRCSMIKGNTEAAHFQDGQYDDCCTTHMSLSLHRIKKVKKIR